MDQWRDLVNTVMNLHVAGYILTNREIIAFSIRTMLHGVSYFHTQKYKYWHHC
jgi:hypothetical protein